MANLFVRIARESESDWHAKQHFLDGALPRNPDKEVAARSAAPLRRNRWRMRRVDSGLFEVFAVFVVQFV